MAKKNDNAYRAALIIESIIIGLLLVLILTPLLFKKTDNEFEIERKWLIQEKDIPYDLSGSNVQIYDIAQTYINFSPEIRIRDVNNGSYYVLTIKTDDPAFKGLKRTEQEYRITEEDYLSILSKKEGSTIHKTRYRIPNNGRIIEIDIFHDQLEGLAYMEIEFPSTEAANSFDPPDWVIQDVTTDMSYKNKNLAKYGIPDSFKNYLMERNKNE